KFVIDATVTSSQFEAEVRSFECTACAKIFFSSIIDTCSTLRICKSGRKSARVHRADHQVSNDA
ncbi:hypothetical protein ALC53_08383, partial [Atta colombica]